MAISEKRIIPLSIEKCEAFKPKREKEKEKLQIDLNLIDEDEIAFKSNDIAGRKSSADSTSVSKPEDISELSCPNTPVSIPKEIVQIHFSIFIKLLKSISEKLFQNIKITKKLKIICQKVNI